MNRRDVLRGIAASGALPLLGCGQDPIDTPAEQWLSAHGDGPYGVAFLGSDGLKTVDSSFRGHDLAQNPVRPEQVVMFGRRPGLEALVLDSLEATRLSSFSAASGHSMMGHGFFSPDGARLYSTEADNVSGAGVLVIRDTQDWRVLNRIPTEGIGPHQAILLPDGATAVVANGGILTRPETGREKLNLDTMRSSLTYISLATGTVIESQTVAESKASIRHLEAAADGTVVVGLQVQREAMDHSDVVSLGGVHRVGEPIELFDRGLEVMGTMNDYVGSVAVCSKNRVAGLTSPRGDLVAFWDIDGGDALGAYRLSDVSGITLRADESAFVVSSSTGEVRHLDSRTLEELPDQRQRLDGIRWDNHLITVTAGGRP